MGNEREQLTSKAMLYRGHLSPPPLPLPPSRYLAVSCTIILAVDGRRVKRDSELKEVRHGADGDERNSKDGAPLRCKPAAMSGGEEQWGPDKGVRGRLRDGGGNRRDGCSGFPAVERKGGFERARRVANRNEGLGLSSRNKAVQVLSVKDRSAQKKGRKKGDDRYATSNRSLDSHGCFSSFSIAK